MKINQTELREEIARTEEIVALPAIIRSDAMIQQVLRNQLIIMKARVKMTPSEIGRLGGSAKSTKKAKSSARNGGAGKDLGEWIRIRERTPDDAV